MSADSSTGVTPLEAAARAITREPLETTSGDIVIPANWLSDSIGSGMTVEDMVRGVVSLYLQHYGDSVVRCALSAAIEALHGEDVRFNGEPVEAVNLGSLDTKHSGWYAPKLLLRRALGLEP